MRRKKTDEKVETFQFYYTELQAFAEYLQKQEELGYRLKKIENGILTFEKSEPRKIRYCAEIFKSASHEDFIELCENEGWEFVDVYNGELFVFRTQDEDAVDIMTDQKEKNKACAKRILRQPGFWIGLFYMFHSFLHLIMTMNNSGLNLVTLFEIKILNYIYLIFIALFSLTILIRIADYFIWKTNTSYSKNVKKTETSSLKRTITKRKFYSVLSCFAVIICYCFLIYLSPQFFLQGINLLFAFAIIIYFYIKYSSEKIKPFKKHNMTIGKFISKIYLIIILSFICLLLLGTENIVNSYTNSLNAIYNSQNIPITLSDLGVEAGKFENEIKVEGTRLVHFYTVTSDAEGQYNEEESSIMRYNILITDSSYIQQKYINQILKDYDEYEIEFMKVTSPETDWDYYYKVKHDDETYYNGFAVKDNILVNIDWGVNSKKDFFEVAYDKIFGE